MDLAKTPFRAGEMQIFDLEGNFSPRGSPKKPDPSAHTTDLHEMLFTYRKNPIVWPHCLGKKTPLGSVLLQFPVSTCPRFFINQIVPKQDIHSTAR